MLTVNVGDFRKAAARLNAVDLEAAIAEGSRQVAPMFAGLVSSRASTRPERSITSGSAVVTAKGVRVIDSSGTLSHGLSEDGAIEFGGRKSTKTTYMRRSKRGNVHKVTRNTTAQLRPFNRNGYVFLRAQSPFTKALLRAWVKSTTEALEKSLGVK